MKATLWMALAAAVIFPARSDAQPTTYSQVAEADTFVSSGQPGVNFGTMGAMEIAAPTSAQPRTEETLLRFNTAAMQASFDADYGPGNWVVTGVALRLFSNVPTAGQQPSNASFNRIAAGGFEFDLANNNSWSETGITWNTLPDLLPGPGNSNTLKSLGTFFWPADGRATSTWTLGADASLASEIYNGGEVTILGQPTPGSTVGFLFNTRTSNPGYLDVTIAAVPEPSTGLLTVSGMGALVGWARRRKRNQRQQTRKRFAVRFETPTASLMPAQGHARVA